MKYCKHRKIEKDDKFFRIQKTNGYAYPRTICKPCEKKAKAIWYKTPKGRHTDSKARLRKVYGISWADYGQMFQSQGGLCKICGCSEETLKNTGYAARRLSVDHCHTTKKVRGLLCNKCNSLLGWAKDDINILLKAIEYLQNETPGA